MSALKIKNIAEVRIFGVTVTMPDSHPIHRGGHFHWTPSPEAAAFASGEVAGGFLKAWPHDPEFTELESHEDAETFFFVRGTALMLFGDIAANGAVDPLGLQLVRIPPHTSLIIDRGKGHTVAVAEGDEPVEAVVFSPRMAANKVRLDDVVTSLPRAGERA